MSLIAAGALGSDPGERCASLEHGHVLFFPQSPIAISTEDRTALIAAVPSGGRLHKNISYRPAEDRVSGLEKGADHSAQMAHRALRNFSEAAIGFVGGFLAIYRDDWRIDYASFRGVEEDGRDLPLKKRNDLLHTDAFPTRPTNGDLILRFFVNINPARPRVWVVSDPFEKIAPSHAGPAGLERIAAHASPAPAFRRALRAVGLPVKNRSPYDEFMLGFHDYLKKNGEYQRNCPKYRFEFPPDSAWMVFTDVVPHSVLSGQYALEQTFLIARRSLTKPHLAPASVLEAIAKRSLVVN